MNDGANYFIMVAAKWNGGFTSMTPAIWRWNGKTTVTPACAMAYVADANGSRSKSFAASMMHERARWFAKL
jgi:hypothetical protein